jgi:hypothetical protein
MILPLFSVETSFYHPVNQESTDCSLANLKKKIAQTEINQGPFRHFPFDRSAVRAARMRNRQLPVDKSVFDLEEGNGQSDDHFQRKQDDRDGKETRLDADILRFLIEARKGIAHSSGKILRDSCF